MASEVAELEVPVTTAVDSIPTLAVELYRLVV